MQLSISKLSVSDVLSVLIYEKAKSVINALEIGESCVRFYERNRTNNFFMVNIHAGIKNKNRHVIFDDRFFK